MSRYVTDFEHWQTIEVFGRWGVDGHRTKPSRAVTHIGDDRQTTYCGLKFPPVEWYMLYRREPNSRVCVNCSRHADALLRQKVGA